MTQTSANTEQDEALRVLFDRSALDLRTWVPATVTKVNSASNVDVRPDISKIQTLDDVDRELPLAVVPGVPVVNWGDVITGLYVHIPITEGTEGWLAVADRPLDEWQYGDGAAPPPALPMLRHHDLTDAVFLPAGSRDGHTRPVLEGKIGFTNEDGTCTVELDATTVLVTVPGGASMLIEGDAVTIDAADTNALGDLTVTGQLTVGGAVVASGGLTLGGGSGNTAAITGNVDILGNLRVHGNINGDSFTGDNT